MSKFCLVCNTKVMGETRVGHFSRKHPTMPIYQKGEEGDFHIKCGTCNHHIGNSSYASVYKHYKDIHPECLPASPTEAEKIGIITTQNATPHDLDRFLEQVNKNTALLKETQAKNKELLATTIRYATRIVELENQIANQDK